MSRNHIYVMTREERKKVRARKKILLTMKRIKMRAIAMKMMSWQLLRVMI